MRLKGRLGEVRDIDQNNGCAAVSFDPRHPESAWLRLPRAQLRIVSLTPENTQRHLQSAVLMSSEVDTWKMRIAPGLQIHEKMFLACANRFFHGAIKPVIAAELQAYAAALGGGDESNSDGDESNSDGDDGACDRVSDTVLLYKIAKVLLRFKPQDSEPCTKRIEFDPLPCMPDHRLLSLTERKAAQEARRAHEDAVIKKVRSVAKAWCPEAVNGVTGDFTADMRRALKGDTPFSIDFVRRNAMDQLFTEGRSSQGGPIRVTALHVASRLGDTPLCSLLHKLGATTNPNILIPNDQGSGGTPNRSGGGTWSQYRWGLVTPMRLAQVHGHVSTVAWFRTHGGSLGVPTYTSISDDMAGSTFARLGAPGFSYLADGSCWTNSEESMIYYLNTYMGGERKYPNVLYCGKEVLKLDDEDAVPDVQMMVTEEYEHDEPPAAPDGTEAVVADIMWAQHVETRIHAAEIVGTGASNATLVTSDTDMIWMECDTAATPSSEVWTAPEARRASDFGERIHIVRFTRSGNELQAALHSGAELEPVRAAAQEAGNSCRLRSGASIFVYPAQYSSILSVLPDAELRPHHVVVSEAFLPLVYQEIVQLPSKSNIRPRSLREFALVEGDMAETICVVDLTFYNSMPSRLRSSASVTQSTSEAHHILNCRRRTSQE